MRSTLPRIRPPRRGVTMIEMLVTVALLVLMMTVIVSIFQAATGAITVSRTYQELDNSLRQLSGTLHTDLQGVTARLTPPLNPRDNQGYFEYGENTYADLQGEDTDDYLRFTAKSPEGQPFTGRVWLPPRGTPNVVNQGIQPILITSQYAEIIYFLRNGNLYRRVFLVVPERQSSLGQTGNANSSYPSPFGGMPFTSWLGMNDVSARPHGTPLGDGIPRLNTLGDLSNRENRAFYPRFANDYLITGSNATGIDLLPDDTNGDGIHDWYPTLYPGVFASGLGLVHAPGSFSGSPNPTSGNTDLLSFPYLYPGAYSKFDPSSNGAGQLHGLFPNFGFPLVNGTVSSSPNNPPYGYSYSGGFPTPNPLIFSGSAFTTPPDRPNHAPLELGDNLAAPSSAAMNQTWWGFPTWKETMSSAWIDPFHAINVSGSQSVGLSWSDRLLASPTGLLPPMSGSLNLQPFNDGAGTATFGSPNTVFQDDLVMTGVRSFDVKAYDNAVPGYVDLGYSFFVGGVSSPAFPSPAARATANQLLQTFGHEGRIPPLLEDYRVDPQFPASNVGDDTAGVNRLRRVFDTWSTDYTQAPASGVNPSTGSPIGMPFGPPIYPSYPAPYPIPLRGIQIQIRVVDPRNERIKMLTIRQDFSDKL